MPAAALRRALLALLLGAARPLPSAPPAPPPWWELTGAEGSRTGDGANVERFDMFRWVAANGGHIYHRQVKLGMLRRDLLSTPTGPLIDELVPEAAWMHALMRWRRVKLWFVKFCIARYWERLV